MQLALFFAAFIALGEASARPQSKGKGKGGGDLIGGLLKGMGGSVPNGPAPGGCSKYEIIVGMQVENNPQTASSTSLTDFIGFKARGTGEPGPFGSVVGDKLVRTVTRQLPGSRGYAVQVRLFLYFPRKVLTAFNIVSRQHEHDSLRTPGSKRHDRPAQSSDKSLS